MPGTDPWARPGPPAYGPVPGRRSKAPLIVIGAVAAVVLLALVGGAIWLAGGSAKGGGGAADAKGGEPVGWQAGSCIWVSANTWTRPTPSPLTPQVKQAIEQAKQYSPISCSDPKALAKITGLGATVPAGGKLTDDGCPDDTDLAVQDKGAAGTGGQVYCTRNVKDPHPGDPGGGGGGLVAGDCVYVGSSNSNRLVNDQIAEETCAEAYYAKVTARVADKSGCPDGTLSRLPYPDRKAGILCLAQADDKAYIAKPGDCVNWPANMYYPVTKETCGKGVNVYPLAAIVEAPSQCPAGSTGRQHTGYDGYLCLKR